MVSLLISFSLSYPPATHPSPLLPVVYLVTTLVFFFSFCTLNALSFDLRLNTQYWALSSDLECLYVEILALKKERFAIITERGETGCC